MPQEPAKYMLLVNWVKEQIVQNNLPYGQRFYSEKEMSDMFAVSRQTVRHAVGILEQEGYVVRRRGSGTYVAYQETQRREANKVVGVISTYMDSYIFPSIIKGIDMVLAKNGYTMHLALTHNRVENESRALRLMMENHVEGLIVEPTKSGLYNPNRELYQALRRQRRPLIFFNASYPDMDFPHVCMDDRLAGQMATEHLLACGHRKIAAIFQSDDRQGHLRYAGYVEALKKAGLEVNSSNVLWFATEDIPYLAQEYARICRCVANCTGVVCYNDQIAYAVVSRLVQEGVRIPEDVSVVGIDNAEIAAMCPVPLTTLSHPMTRLGETAAKNILRLIVDSEFDATVIFQPELVTRDSVKMLCPVRR